MRRFRLTLLLLVFTLLGCGPIMWYKKDLDRDQFKKDDYECIRDMKQSRAPDDIDLYKLCMRSKGYSDKKPD
jgi:hypothetical protein